MAASDSDDDGKPLVLPADTLQALADFQTERTAREQRFKDLKEQAEDNFANGQSFSMDLFEEDWNVSQFWYTDETANVLAGQLLFGATDSSAIAVVSAPSVYVAIKRLCLERKLNPSIMLFEYDMRFKIFGDEFQFYDFHAPLQYPSSLKARFDRMICDPPFLSEDCQAKTALTARSLARQWSKDLRFVSCTGERMEAVIHRLYGKIGVATTSFEPEHRKGLSNEFRCYANFTCSSWSQIHAKKEGPAP